MATSDSSTMKTTRNFSFLQSTCSFFLYTGNLALSDRFVITTTDLYRLVSVVHTVVAMALILPTKLSFCQVWKKLGWLIWT